MAIASSRHRGRPALDKLDRCAELWRQVRPELEARRYRGLTIKLLARACNLSPSSVYHYFGSKDEFIFFPLSATSEYCERQMAPLATLPPDPGIRLRAALAIAVSAHVDLSLAAELATEAGRFDVYRPYLLERYDLARGILAGMLLCAKPSLEAPVAEQAADRIVALIAGWYWSGRTGGQDAVIRTLDAEIEALSPARVELIENSPG